MTMMMIMILSVKTLNQEFCTRTFAFYVVTKDDTVNIGTGALCVLVGPMLHTAAVIHYDCDY
jgi:hypothetical protein